MAQGACLSDLVNLRGQGRCAITLDPEDRLPGQQPYQGVVPLHGDQREPLQQLSQVLEHYMLQSEQLDTRLVLAANDEIAAGLLIQRLPVEGEGNLGGRRNEDDIGLSEAFNRIAHLASTLTRDELLTLDADTVLSLILPKAQRQYAGKRNGIAKDPRLGVTISAGEIRKHGRRLV